MTSTIDTRFEDLEAKVAYQEHTIQELNDTIFQQQKDIDELRATCKILVERYRELAATNAGPASPVDEKPPHY